MCAVSVQYGLKHLIDIIAAGPEKAAGLWTAFALLCSLVAADSLLWRIAGWAAAYTFVAVTGDIRRDLFAHLSGHSPSYFAERLPGALASRITATVQRRVHHREHRIVERSATGGGGGLLDRPHRFGEPDHGGRAGCGGGWPGRAGLPPGAPRHAAASQFRLQGGGGGWRTGGRDRQHVRGARVRRHVPRAAAHRRNDRRRDGRSPHAASSIWSGCG